MCLCADELTTPNYEPYIPVCELVSVSVCAERKVRSDERGARKTVTLCDNDLP